MVNLRFEETQRDVNVFEGDKLIGQIKQTQDGEAHLLLNEWRSIRELNSIIDVMKKLEESGRIDE